MDELSKVLPPRSRRSEAVSSAAEETTQMDTSPLAGKPAPKEMLVDLARLEHEYYKHRRSEDAESRDRKDIVTQPPPKRAQMLITQKSLQWLFSSGQESHS